MDLNNEQEALFEVIKRAQKDAGQELRAKRVCRNSVVMSTWALASAMDELINEDIPADEVSHTTSNEQALLVFMSLVSMKIGVRLLSITPDKHGYESKILTFTYSPVGKEKAEMYKKEQERLGRKRRTLYMTDAEFEACQKLLAQSRQTETEVW